MDRCFDVIVVKVESLVFDKLALMLLLNLLCFTLLEKHSVLMLCYCNK